MFQILRFRADATSARITRALALTPAQRVALVFPSGARVVSAQPEVLQAIAGYVRAAHKHVTIVGGDAYLRACAVTAGLAAATALDEWRGAPAMDRDSIHRRQQDDTFTRLMLVEPSDSRAREREDEVDARWDAEPPEYLANLLAPEARDTGGQEERAHSFGSLRVLEPPSDVETFEAVELASERDEEGISDTILATSEHGCSAGMAH
jgi:hypothetical protein